MHSFANTDEALTFLDDMLARLRHRRPDVGDHLYTSVSAGVCATDMHSVQSALVVINASLKKGVNREARRGLRHGFRLRLQELHYEISEVEEELLAERTRIGQQRRQVHAAAAWNQSTHLV